MTKLILVALLALPVISHATVTRDIDGVAHYLHYDFDTADGECVLQGYEYASSFYSFSTGKTPVLKMNADGTIKEIVTGANNLEVIDGMTCE